jgi:hypothetical protein
VVSPLYHGPFQIKLKYTYYQGETVMGNNLNHHIGSRRMVIAVISLASLTYLGVIKEHDVSLAIVGVVAAVAGANAMESRSRPTPKPKIDDEDIK